MKPPQVTCPACNGGGKVNLEEPLLTTYGFFPRAATRLTAVEVSEAIKDGGGNVSPNAVNNRLERLRDLGLLMRERTGGRTWTYRRPKADEIEHDADGQPHGIERGPFEIGTGLSNAAKSEPMRALAGATFKPKRGQKKV